MRENLLWCDAGRGIRSSSVAEECCQNSNLSSQKAL